MEGNAYINGVFFVFYDYDRVVTACRNCVFCVVKRIAAGSHPEPVAMYYENSEERNKIEIVNSETARGEAWGTSRAGTRI